LRGLPIDLAPIYKVWLRAAMMAMSRRPKNSASTKSYSLSIFMNI